jgi:hypothetical protein
MDQSTTCTASVGFRCAGHWDTDDVDASGCLYGSDWFCKNSGQRNTLPEWRGQSLGAEAAQQGAAVRGNYSRVMLF